VPLHGAPVRVRPRPELAGAEVVASRSEVKRGQWESFGGRSFKIVAMGSVAYKLARVAGGLSDATWTLVPKHEWDVAAGVALVQAAGGAALALDGTAPVFNRPKPKLTGLIAVAPGLAGEVGSFLGLGSRSA
jgi:myo-inositol-1(or 4)-monophosphatase